MVSRSGECKYLLEENKLYRVSLAQVYLRKFVALETL